MGITMSNISDGGSVSITLNYIINYDQTHLRKYARDKIPGKAEGGIDGDTYISDPSSYSFVAMITDAQKVTLETLDNEPAYTIVYSDNQLSNKNVRMEKVQFTINTGRETGRPTELPWNASIELTGLDH